MRLWRRKRWAVVELPGKVVHVVPRWDQVEHVISEEEECICLPNVEQVEPAGWLYTHSSLDGRELRE